MENVGSARAHRTTTTVRRGAVAVVLVLAAVLAVPAAAQAADAYWYDNGVKVTAATAVHGDSLGFGLSGSISGNATGVSCWTSGFAGSIDNGTPGAGSITSTSFGTCSGTGGLSGCPATVTGQNFPWTLHARYDGGLSSYYVDISGVDVQIVYSSPCSVTVNARGTLTGLYSNLSSGLTISPGSSLDLFVGTTKVGTGGADTAAILTGTAGTTPISLAQS